MHPRCQVDDEKVSRGFNCNTLSVQKWRKVTLKCLNIIKYNLIFCWLASSVNDSLTSTGQWTDAWLNVFFTELMVPDINYWFPEYCKWCWLMFHQFYSHSIPKIFDRVQIGVVSGPRQTPDPMLIFPFLNMRVSLEKKIT